MRLRLHGCVHGMWLPALNRDRSSYSSESSSNSAFAFCRSGVSNPSVNQLQTSASSLRAYFIGHSEDKLKATLSRILHRAWRYRNFHADISGIA